MTYITIIVHVDMYYDIGFWNHSVVVFFLTFVTVRKHRLYIHVYI